MLVDRLLTHSPTCPEPTKHSPLPDITWESFRNTLKKSEPNKAGGRDFTNNYTLHISPPPVQQFIWRVCNHYLHQPLPEKWLEANIILLFNKGDVTNPVNYRPIALLNSVYKNIVSYWQRPSNTPSYTPPSSPGFPTADAKTTFSTSYPRFRNQLVATASTLISIRL